MTTHLNLPGDPPLSVALVRSARAKRMSLRVSHLDGRVRLTLPKRCSLRMAQDFLNDRASWVRGHVKDAVQHQSVGIGGAILYKGHTCQIVPGTGRSVVHRDQELRVPGPADRVPIRLRSFLQNEARKDLVGASDHYAKTLGVQIGRISLKDTRSRWGSCSSLGNLNYSWRLIMAPTAVLNYVAAHEVAHRIEMNHSDRFWALVAGLDPTYETSRQWLRTEGTQLHSYGFDAA